VESTRADLTASGWRRLILCEWAESDDSLTTPDDVEAAIRGSFTVLEPRPGVQYVAALDVSTCRDLTAPAVGHRERRAEGPVVVVDRVLYWRLPAGGRVDLAEAEAVVLRVCRQYRPRLRFDRMQAEQMTANLERAGVTVREYVLSAQGPTAWLAASTGRSATARCPCPTTWRCGTSSCPRASWRPPRSS